MASVYAVIGEIVLFQVVNACTFHSVCTHYCNVDHVPLSMLHSFLQLLNISPLQTGEWLLYNQHLHGWRVRNYDSSMNPILFCYEDCLGSDFRNILCASMSAWRSRRTNTSVSSAIITELLWMEDATPVWKWDHQHGHLRDDLVTVICKWNSKQWIYIHMFKFGLQFSTVCREPNVATWLAFRNSNSTADFPTNGF